MYYVVSAWSLFTLWIKWTISAWSQPCRQSAPSKWAIDLDYLLQIGTHNVKFASMSLAQHHWRRDSLPASLFRQYCFNIVQVQGDWCMLKSVRSGWCRASQIVSQKKTRESLMECNAWEHSTHFWAVDNYHALLYRLYAQHQAGPYCLIIATHPIDEIIKLCSQRSQLPVFQLSDADPMSWTSCTL